MTDTPSPSVPAETVPEETPSREWLMKRVAFYASECERQGLVIDHLQKALGEALAGQRAREWQPVQKEDINAGKRRTWAILNREEEAARQMMRNQPERSDTPEDR